MPAQKKRIIRILSAVVIVSYVLIGLLLLISGFVHSINPVRYLKSPDRTMTISIPYEVGGEAAEKDLELTRGTEIRVKRQGDKESEVEYDGHVFQLDNEYLAKSLQEVVDTDQVYARRLISLRDARDGKLSDAVAEKGEALEVVSASVDDFDPETGVVGWYQVRKDDKTYWIPGQYTETTQELALKNYGEGLSYSTEYDAIYGRGYSEDAYIDQVDYRPLLRKSYEDNVMPEDVNAVHVSLNNLLRYKDELMKLKDTTGINSIVVEMKGDAGAVLYESEVPQNYINLDEYDPIVNKYSMELIAPVFQEFRDNGFYMIGRIAAFKDGTFALSHPDQAITDQKGEPVVYDSEYWVSPYSRLAWEYNVDIAREIAPLVNEVQFDFVRFPEGTSTGTDEGAVNLHNTYNESKVAALQGFLSYARDAMEPYHVYVAGDVFAWPVISRDDIDIGQYVPAIANSVDVISPMPYLEKFTGAVMGLESPSTEPEQTIARYLENMQQQISTLGTQPVIRTWLQGYDGVDAANLREQIAGINEAGDQGYMVWFKHAGEWSEISPRVSGLINSALKKDAKVDVEKAISETAKKEEAETASQGE